jgi:nitroreductase
MTEAPLFSNVVRARHSTRAFLPDPISDDLVRAVLEDAALAPSNCNTQPWDVHIVSGEKRDALSNALCQAFDEGRRTFDFSFDRTAYPERFGECGDAQAASYYSAMNIPRDAHDQRRDAAMRNLTFFGAPNVCLLFMPAVGDNVRVAGDIGMFGQTLLLSLVAHGLAGIPQTFLGFFADTVRECLGVGSDRKLLFGVSFGYADECDPIAAYRIDRLAVEEFATFHR